MVVDASFHLDATPRFPAIEEEASFNHVLNDRNDGIQPECLTEKHPTLREKVVNRSFFLQ